CATKLTIAPPNNHFIAGPDCSVRIAFCRRITHVGSGASVGVRIISSTRVQVGVMPTTPYDHVATTPHSTVLASANRSVAGACGGPVVRAGIVSSTGVYEVGVRGSAPNDHFTTCPDYRMKEAASGRICGVGGRPTVSGRTICSAGV